MFQKQINFLLKLVVFEKQGKTVLAKKCFFKFQSLKTFLKRFKFLFSCTWSEKSFLLKRLDWKLRKKGHGLWTNKQKQWKATFLFDASVVVVAAAAVVASSKCWITCFLLFSQTISKRKKEVGWNKTEEFVEDCKTCSKAGLGSLFSQVLAAYFDLLSKLKAGA